MVEPNLHTMSHNGDIGVTNLTTCIHMPAYGRLVIVNVHPMLSHINVHLLTECFTYMYIYVCAL